MANIERKMLNVCPVCGAYDAAESFACCPAEGGGRVRTEQVWFVPEADLRGAVDTLRERVMNLGHFQRRPDLGRGRIWISRDDVLSLIDETFGGR